MMYVQFEYQCHYLTPEGAVEAGAVVKTELHNSRHEDGKEPKFQALEAMNRWNKMGIGSWQYFMTPKQLQDVKVVDLEVV